MDQIPKSKYDHFVFSTTHLLKLSPELQTKAFVELKEHPEKRDKDLEEFRNMIKREPICIDTSDTFLIRYLRSSKYNKSRALRVIENFLTTKKNNPDLFNETLLPSNVKQVIESNLLTILPRRDAEGRPIFLFRLNQWNTNEMSIHQIFRALYVIGETLIQDESVQIRGVIAIVDFEGLALHHVRLFRPVLAYKLVNTIQDGFPIRVKGVHVVRENRLVDISWPLIRSFLKPKNKERMFFHGHDFSSLYKYIPREALPCEYGGSDGPLDTREWCDIVMKFEEQFKEKLNYKMC